MEPAVREARERWRVIRLETIETTDERIRAVAKEAAESHSALLRIGGESGGSEALFDFVLALAMENPVPLLRSSLSKEAARESARTERTTAAIQRRRAASSLIVELAREFGAALPERQALAIDVDESWFGSAAPDRVTLTNVAGCPLTHCVVAIELRGKDGPWVRNVHYVPSWPDGEALWIDYPASDNRDLAALRGVTAVEVQEVAVELWSEQLHSPRTVMQYAGRARDEDRSKLMDKMLAIEADYVARPVFESGPCIGLTMRGIKDVPACVVTATCRDPANGRVTLDAKLDRWSEGMRISLQSEGKLTACPAVIDVTIAIAGTTQKWARKLESVRAR